MPLPHGMGRPVAEGSTLTLRAIGRLDELATENPDGGIWAIGGAAVYAKTMTEVDELLLT